MQYVVQIAKERNFSRAAEKLHIAQPSLSQQLSKLEKELGVLLFSRSTNSVELTHAGAVFMEKAREIVDMVEQLRQEMDDIAQMRKGRLIVGSLPITGCACVAASCCPSSGRAIPRSKSCWSRKRRRRLEQLTASGQTDICLLSLPLGDPRSTWQPLIEEEIMPRRAAATIRWPIGRSAARGAHRRAGRRTVHRAEERARLPPNYASICAVKPAFEPHIVFESGNIETVQSLVAAGMGIAFVPQMVDADARHAALAPSISGWPIRADAHARHRLPQRAAICRKRREAFIETLTGDGPGCGRAGSREPRRLIGGEGAPRPACIRRRQPVSACVRSSRVDQPPRASGRSAIAGVRHAARAPTHWPETACPRLCRCSFAALTMLRTSANAAKAAAMSAIASQAFHRSSCSA